MTQTSISWTKSDITNTQNAI